MTSLLVSIPLSVFQIGLYFLIGWLGTRFKQTVLCMVGFTFVNIIGTFVLRFVAPSTTTRAGLLIAFYCMQSFQATNPSMYAMMSRNVAGQTKKSIVYMLFCEFLPLPLDLRNRNHHHLTRSHCLGRRQCDRTSDLPGQVEDSIHQLALHPPRLVRLLHCGHSGHAPASCAAQQKARLACCRGTE